MCSSSVAAAARVTASRARHCHPTPPYTARPARRPPAPPAGVQAPNATCYCPLYTYPTSRVFSMAGNYPCGTLNAATITPTTLIYNGGQPRTVLRRVWQLAPPRNAWLRPARCAAAADPWWPLPAVQVPEAGWKGWRQQPVAEAPRRI